MVQVIGPKYDPLAELGSGFSQGIRTGLQESMQGQFQNRRLASTIKGIKPGGTYLENYAALLEGGATPEQIQTILPHLQSNSFAENLSPNNQNPTVQPSSQQNQIPNQQSNQPPINQSRQPIPIQQNQPPSSFINPETTEAGLKTIHKPTLADIKQKAAQNIQDEPYLYQGNIPLAMADAKTQLDQDYENQTRLQEQGKNQATLQDTFDKSFNENVQKLTHKTPYGDLSDLVPGRVVKKYNIDARKKVLNGMPQEQAIQEETENVRQLALDINNLRNNIGHRPFFGKGSQELYSSIDTSRKKFADLDELELFNNEIQTYLDIGPHSAGMHTWEISKPLSKGFTPDLNTKNIQQIAEQFAPLIQEDDSFWSLGYKLGKEGLPDDEIIQAIGNLADEGIINLNERQNRERSSYYSINLGKAPIAGIAFDTFGLSPYKKGVSKISTIEFIKRQLGKE